MIKHVSDIVALDGFKLVAGKEAVGNSVDCVYIGDLLSWVMGRAPENNAWVTIQGHINIIAVALLTTASCIIIAEGAEINPDTIAKADGEGIPVLSTGFSSFEVARIMIENGVGK